MHKSRGRILCSATDLVGFLECEHLTTLDLADLEDALPRAPLDVQAQLLQDKGQAHERKYVERLKATYSHFVDNSERRGDVWESIGFTLEAMKAGAEIIYQGALGVGDFIGYPDFLRRVESPSLFGDYSYEVLDAKLARASKTKFIVQLAFYSDCLARAQGVPPSMMHLVLGDLSEESYRFDDYSRYVAHLKARFEERVKTKVATYPAPCDHCDLCKWRRLCEERRITDDHLCQVANITKVQTKKLQAAGITTLKALGQLEASVCVPKMNHETLERLCHQARLQLETRETGERKVELLDTGTDTRGLARLPRPDGGDLFFDMEGDPYEDKGLEYLFGVYYFEGGTPQFKAFWAHTRAEEKKAFEEFMDFAAARLKQFPDAHIYHYAHYEPTALKRLMSMHGSREADIDNLLRRKKFVDLYRVVREGIRVSEPRYSIKNIEHFYLEKRTAEVTSAGASIVYYERWKESGDPQLLKDIETYNFDDVRSTYKLRQWLLSLRPAQLKWANAVVTTDHPTQAAGELTESEKRLIPYRTTLVDLLPHDRASWRTEDQVRALTYYLLDFHRRADKPAWWAMFARMELSHEELIDDAECLGNLKRVAEPERDKRSLVWTYEYHEQESKLRTGSKVVLASTREGLGEVTLDEDKRRAYLRRGVNREPLPDRVSLGPGGPIDAGDIRDALFRFADALIEGLGKYRANVALLRRDIPRLKGHAAGERIVAERELTVARIADAIAKLDGSYLFVQGPPGAGKTSTGSHAIVELMRRGFRVGVTSNSHKAIINLLHAVEKVARTAAFVFRGAKKGSQDDPETHVRGERIEDIFSNEDIDVREYQLVAGTAWLFSDPKFDQQLDFLFVDEAGQVCLANLIAMGTSAKNIVLLGDQMQLGQPIQGVHPGHSGDSSLEYLLEGRATIPPERGIFLAETWRMHPDVCRFISDAVYDRRLQPRAENVNQTLVLGADVHPALKPTGVSFIDAQHDACSQASEEEVRIVLDLVESLVRQRYRNKQGVERPMTLENILVVAPYNVQVNLLTRTLPDGSRVGTVDKFQGQEAEVVIVSMTTSNGEYLPRFVDFLFSKNRLNVAISRARSLAIVVANPDLLRVHCTSPQDMALVNTLCWVREYSLATVGNALLASRCERGAADVGADR